MDRSQFSALDLCALLEIYRIARSKCLSAHRLHDILNKTREDAWDMVCKAKSRCANWNTGVKFNDEVSVASFQIEKGNRLNPVKTGSLPRNVLKKQYPNENVLSIAWSNTKKNLLQKYTGSPDFLKPIVAKEIQSIMNYTRKISRILNYADPTETNGFIFEKRSV